MAIYTNLPIYKASYTLLLDVTRQLRDVPRDCRYTLGQDLRRSLTEIIKQIYRANRTRDKLPIIQAMRETLLEAQVSIRLMNDMRYISEKSYLQLINQTAGMSKQMVAWEKSLRPKSSP